MVLAAVEHDLTAAATLKGFGLAAVATAAGERRSDRHPWAGASCPKTTVARGFERS